jgi:RNA exonuclease 4
VCPQHEILAPTKRSGKKKRRGKKPSKKRNKMEVEIVSEQETVKYLALDCEMVGVGKYGERSALARVSIVNWEGDVVLDKFVKVAEPVTDYRTFVSGIRAEDLESDEAMDFDACCDLVANTLKDKIVVGHALKNDFDVMNIRLPWYMIRDTARYEPLMKLDPKDPGQLVAKRLRDLAAEKLSLVIQQEGQEHCSVEDAGAAMELYKQARKKWEQVVEYKLNKTRAIQEQKQRELLMSYEKSQLSTEKVSMTTIACS